ncbi:MAG TPA: hypothetical protein VK787_12335, partial [Puia sp.]|nr:hypothetical protein [Puia sp.]
MISRRNIRVKVMQTLYTLETGGQSASPEESVKILEKHFIQTRQLFLYLIYFVVELAQYAETDSRRRSGKHLPTYEDKNINIKLAGNELIRKILNEPSYQKAIKTDKPQLLENADLIKRLYQELVETEEYKKYASVTERDKKSEKEILDFIFTDLVLPNELFEAYIEEI